METIRDRLNQLIKTLGLSKNEFAREIKSTGAMISKITTKDVNFGVDVFKKIIDRYPSINHLWLMSGGGEMWTENQAFEPSIHPSNENLSPTERVLNNVLNQIADQTIKAGEKHRKITEVSQPVPVHYMRRVHELIKQNNPELYKLKANIDTLLAFKDVIYEIEENYVSLVNYSLFRYPKGQFDIKEYEAQVTNTLKELQGFKQPLADICKAILSFYGDMEKSGADQINFDDYTLHDSV